MPFPVGILLSCVSYALYMSRKKIALVQTVNEMLGIDPESYSHMLHVTITDSDTVLVQGFERVCEYNDRCASFLKDTLLCEISGEGLYMSGVAQDTARIRGEIHSVTYSEVGR